jgi:hypothetical protein
MILNSPTISGSLTVTGNIIASGSITLSGSVASASYALSASNAQTASFANSFTVAGTLTAQTLVVQTITSSVDFVTGSTRFGSTLANTMQVTGSILLSSGSVLNVGRTDNGYPFTVSSQFAKTDTTGRGLMFLGSNEAYASNPFGLVVTVTGASTLASRVVQIGTTDFGLANGGLLSLQGLLNITGSFVGIGTTTPLTTLDAKQTATGTATVNSAFRDSSSNGNALQIWNGNNEARFRAIYYGTASDQNITFYTITSAGSEAERLRITSAGTLSIGNSSPQNLYWANVRGAVIGNYSSISSNSSSGWTSLANNAAQTIGSSESTGWAYQNTDSAAKFSLTNGGFRFQVSGTGTAGNAISWTDAVTIMDAANGHKVGIRTTSPRTMLQVTPVSNGETPVLGTATGAVTFTSANTNYGIQFNSTSDGSYFIQSQRFDASATAYPLGLNPVGSYVYLGKGWGATAHRINLEVSQGNNVLVVSGYSGANNDTAKFMAVDGTGGNAAASALWLATNSATGRSITAGGAINASGTDYAEYMTKAISDVINKGDIVGINSEAKLTNIFADAISFVVKSTDPSYVGGDIWGNEDALGKKPERTIDQTEEEFDPILAEFEAKLEEARAKVDRIAFSGQVPCNVAGANVGDYIIPIELENGKIGGQAVTNPTFEQYQISVGKVWKIMEDGRAWIAVKIG